MSLRSVDITKVKKLSLGEVRLQAPEVAPEPTVIKKPPTEEEIAYRSLLAINPLLQELVNRLNLVSEITGEPISSQD
jgi:hypothetical protein